MIKKIFDDIKNIVDCDDYYVQNVEYIKESGNWILRVSINSTNKEVDIDMCVSATHLINAYLDENDPIDEEYVLEVSSVGINDTINDFNEAIGKTIIIKTYSKINNKKVFIGILVKYNNEEYIIKCNDKEVIIPKKLVSQIRYHIEY